MSETEKLICGDCKGITYLRTNKRGSAFIEKILFWALFFPGIFYGIWRNLKPKRICQYCGSEFLLPNDSTYAQDLLKSITKNK